MTETYACCRKCRGPAPHHFCQNSYKAVFEPGCDCHQKQDAIARKKRGRLYKDTTAEYAISRAMKGTKK